jgi:hypothetical protein
MRIATVSAQATDGRVRLACRTESETDNVGFAVERAFAPAGSPPCRRWLS